MGPSWLQASLPPQVPTSLPPPQGPPPRCPKQQFFHGVWEGHAAPLPKQQLGVLELSTDGGLNRPVAPHTAQKRGAPGAHLMPPSPIAGLPPLAGRRMQLVPLAASAPYWPGAPASE